MGITDLFYTLCNNVENDSDYIPSPSLKNLEVAEEITIFI